MPDIFGFECSGKLNSLGSRTQVNVKTPLITSLKLQMSIYGKKLRQGKIKSLKGSPLTKPKTISLLLCATTAILLLFFHSLNAKDSLRKQSSFKERSATKIPVSAISILREGIRQSRVDGGLFSASLC